jgi:hypothetical protein
MIHAVSRRPLTVDKRLQSRTACVEFVRNRVALGQISVRVLRCSLSASFHQHLTLIRPFLTGTIES